MLLPLASRPGLVTGFKKNRHLSPLRYVKEANTDRPLISSLLPKDLDIKELREVGNGALPVPSDGVAGCAAARGLTLSSG